MNEPLQDSEQPGADAADAPPDPAAAEAGDAEGLTGIEADGAADALLPGPVGAALDKAVELVTAGGPVVVILLVLSVIALAIVLLKLWQFHAARIGDRRAARDALRLHRAGQTDGALALAERARDPIARVLARALRGAQRHDLPSAVVREEVVRFGSDLLQQLRCYFRPLEVIASLAPLLGLFGTVIGMIDAFRQLEQAGSQVNPAILSGGIWVALLTTAVGLAVAIPVVAVLNWLESRVDLLAHEMETIVTQVFTEDLSRTQEPEQHRGPTRFQPSAVAGE